MTTSFTFSIVRFQSAPIDRVKYLLLRLRVVVTHCIRSCVSTNVRLHPRLIRSEVTTEKLGVSTFTVGEYIYIYIINNKLNIK